MAWGGGGGGEAGAGRGLPGGGRGGGGGGGGAWLRRVGKRFAGSLALLQTTHRLVLFKLHNFYAGAETNLPKR